MSYYGNRKTRGMKQKMFLLGASRIDEKKNQFHWECKVKGTTNDYDIIIHPGLLQCSCPDYETRGRICKHLYFIIGRIGQCHDMLETLESEIEQGNRGSRLTSVEFNLLSSHLLNRLQSRLDKRKKLVKKSKESEPEVIQDDCTICYESLSEGSIIKCCDGQGCVYHFHNICIENWLSRNSTCPLCRRTWQLNKKKNTDINVEFDPFDILNNNDVKL